jgi:hypothetical protein
VKRAHKSGVTVLTEAVDGKQPEALSIPPLSSVEGRAAYDKPWFNGAHHGVARTVSAQADTNLNPSPQRDMRPMDGEGKCAMHIKVEVSQNRSNTSRLDTPACLES